MGRGNVASVVLSLGWGFMRRICPKDFRRLVERRIDLMKTEHDPTEELNAMHGLRNKMEAIREDGHGEGKFEGNATHQFPTVNPLKKSS